jgi:hypothetical protein
VTWLEGQVMPRALAVTSAGRMPYIFAEWCHHLDFIAQSIISISLCQSEFGASFVQENENFVKHGHIATDNRSRICIQQPF